MLLSVLDQSPVPEGGTRADALRATVGLAAAVEPLGYHRFWVAEHHGSAAFAGTAPEITAGGVLAATSSMRVGSGGVLLPRYQPAKVAEVFTVLSALYPGRVDLGVGRAGGPAGDFPQKLVELLARLPQGPPLWLLGASPGSAELAVELGTAYCFAHFLNPGSGVEAMARYRASARPRGAVAVRVLVADTEAEARRLSRALLLWRARRDLGHDEPIPDPDRVAAHVWSERERDRAAVNAHALVSGTPEQVRAHLVEVANGHGVGELVVNTLTHDPADRLRSYRLLADAMADAPTAVTG
ncbi:MsnO8 family LLM class oxidoreductase [Saccharothrix longispora]|uniref:MsnO8 family LLM class oxidoreductase n=1 Tax=Saccharothrix longispora TaxID=33920 RepID=UPI0028FD48AA|nr:MsnO8 family LLM class oxidoreductase [Saccharothrix longispora]MDU0292378.1 MsnO8 family LLM class oxidoreductase [Saccharothrix longispora]